MADTIRLNKVLRELNISIDRAVDHLDSKGISIEKVQTLKFRKKCMKSFQENFRRTLPKRKSTGGW